MRHRTWCILFSPCIPLVQVDTGGATVAKSRWEKKQSSTRRSTYLPTAAQVYTAHKDMGWVNPLGRRGRGRRRRDRERVHIVHSVPAFKQYMITEGEIYAEQCGGFFSYISVKIRFEWQVPDNLLFKLPPESWGEFPLASCAGEATHKSVSSSLFPSTSRREIPVPV